MRRKSFRPMLDTMEPRIALSGGWFSDFFDSLLGKNSNDNDKKPSYTPAQIAKFQAKKQAAHQARMERLAEWHAAHPFARSRQG